MHACGFDGYNFHALEGSRIVEYKLRQLQDIRFTELTLDNEIEYTEEEDGTKGITDNGYIVKRISKRRCFCKS